VQGFQSPAYKMWGDGEGKAEELCLHHINGMFASRAILYCIYNSYWIICLQVIFSIISSQPLWSNNLLKQLFFSQTIAITCLSLWVPIWLVWHNWSLNFHWTPHIFVWYQFTCSLWTTLISSQSFVASVQSTNSSDFQLFSLSSLRCSIRYKVHSITTLP